MYRQLRARDLVVSFLVGLDTTISDHDPLVTVSQAGGRPSDNPQEAQPKALATRKLFRISRSVMPMLPRIRLTGRLTTLNFAAF